MESNYTIWPAEPGPVKTITDEQLWGEPQGQKEKGGRAFLPNRPISCSGSVISSSDSPRPPLD